VVSPSSLQETGILKEILLIIFSFYVAFPAPEGAVRPPLENIGITGE
jgi:hypothetical protein